MTVLANVFILFFMQIILKLAPFSTVPFLFSLGVTYKIISLRPDKFFGIVKDWIDEMPFMVTDREKSIIDGLDLPQSVGGVAEVAKVLSIGWTQLNESKLRKYAVKIGNSAVAK